MQNHTLVVNALAATGCGLPDLQPEQLDEAAANTEVLHCSSRSQSRRSRSRSNSSSSSSSSR